MIPCIVCDKVPEGAGAHEDKGAPYEQPYGATIFVSHGQYGSTVFDPMGTRDLFLQVNICDDCLKVKAAEQKILLVEKHQRVSTWDHMFWDLEQDPEEQSYHASLVKTALAKGMTQAEIERLLDGEDDSGYIVPPTGA